MTIKKSLVLLSFFIVIFISIYFINDITKEKIILSKKSMEFINYDLKEEIDYQKIIYDERIKNNNDDIVGILRIPEANYETIVPKGNDNEYYLRRLPDKSYSRLGSTFMDYRLNIDTSRKIIIYGHNSSKYEMPFKILENYYDKDYYDKNHYIELISVNGKKTYEIFSVYVETKDFAYYQRINFNDNDFYQHLLNLKSKSLYDTKVNINKEDNVLILQTCSTHKDYLKYERKFLLIISKEVK